MSTLPVETLSPSAATARAKFQDPAWTAKGERRATAPFTGLATLWLNTGTLCNIACTGCYIESTPRNDRLAYLTRAEAAAFIAEARNLPQPTAEVGLTGGEPFLNPDIMAIIGDSLAAGCRVLVLTNAMKPMQRHAQALLALPPADRARLTLRVSLDHYAADKHEQARGPHTWTPTLDGIGWLVAHGFDLAIAGRLMWPEPEARLRDGFARLFEARGIPVDAHAPGRLVLFPEMDAQAAVPEISESCWGILGKAPESVMCASSRMVVKRKGAARPVVVSCTLLPYEPQFEMGATLSEAARPVALNHPHCARFCVLGGASCSAPKAASG